MRQDENGNLTLSWSGLSTYLQCGRKAELTYLEGLQSTKVTKPLTVGSAFHEGARAYVNAIFNQQVNPLTHAVGACLQYVSDVREENKTVVNHETGELVRDEEYYTLLDECYSTAKEMLKQYLPQLGIGTRYEPVSMEQFGGSSEECATEINFVQDIGGGVFVNGYIDAVFYDNERKDLVIVDWKTSGSFTHPFDVAVDGQMHFYAVALKAMGVDVSRGLFVNLHSKPARPARITKTGKISKDKRQRTTWEYWLSTLPEDTDREEVLAHPDDWADFKEGLNPLDDFIREDEIIFTEQVLDDMRVNIFLVADRMKEDLQRYNQGQALPATYHRHNCGFCDFKEMCAKIRYGDDVSEIIEENFTFRDDFENEDRESRLY